MSKEVDERVVSLKFDNQQFEKNAKQSMSTLDKLKEKLKFKNARDGLDDVQDAAEDINFDGMAKAIDNVNGALSAMGVIGKRVLENITDDVYRTTTAFVKSMTIDNVSAGWDKYADKTASVQTIMAATGKTIDEVNESLDKLLWFTDETSYNFTDMVNNIGKFTSAGVDLDVAATAMEGIATWASISGQSVNEASRAMYNLSQAIGVGGVKLIDWKSIENANMATKEFKETVLETGVELGKLKKNADGTYDSLTTTAKGISFQNFTEDLSKMWFDSELLLKTLDKYGGYADSLNQLYNTLWGEGQEVTTSSIISDLRRIAKGQQPIIKYSDQTLKMAQKLSNEVGTIGDRAFAAAQEAKTWTEVVNSVKDAVSTGWMQSFEIIFGNYAQAKTLWTRMANDFWDIFASGAERRNTFLEEALNVSGYDKLGEYLKGYGVEIESFEKKLLSLYGDDVVEQLINDNGTIRKQEIALKDLVAQYDSFSDAVQNSNVDMTSFVRNTMHYFGEATVETGDKLEYFQKIVDDVFNGVYGNGDVRVKRLADASYEYSTIQSMVNDVLYKGGIQWDNYNQEQIEACGFVAENVAANKDLLKALRSNDKELNKILSEMSLKNGRDLLWDSLLSTLEYITGLTGELRDAFNEVFDVFSARGLYDIIKSFSEWLNSLRLTEKQTESLKSVVQAFARILKTVFQVVSKLASTFSKIFGIFKPLTNLLFSVVAQVSKFVNEIEGSNEAVNIFSSALDAVSKAIEWVITKFTDLVNVIIQNEYVYNVLKIIAGIFTILGNSFNKIKNFDLGKIFSKFKINKQDANNLTTLTSSIEKFKKSLKDAKTLDKIGETFLNLGSTLKTALTSFFKPFTDAFKTVSTKLGNLLSDFWDRLTSMAKTASTLSFDTTTGKFSLTGLFGGLLAFGNTAVLLSVSKMISNLGGVFKQFGNLVKSYKQHLGAQNFDLIANGVVKLAGAVLIIATALYAISKIEPDRLWSAVGALLVIALVIGGLVYAAYAIIGKLTELNNVKAKIVEQISDPITNFFEGLRLSLKGFAQAAKLVGFGVAILATAASLLIIVKSLQSLIETIRGTRKAKVEEATEILKAMMWGIAGAIALINLTSGRVKMGSFFNILAFCVAVKVMISALKEIKQIKRSTQALDSLGELLTLLVASIMLINLTARNAKTSLGSMAIILALSVAIKTMVSALSELNNMDDKEFKQGIIRLGSMVLLIVGAIALLGVLYKRTKGTNVIQTAFAFLAIVGAIKSMASVLETLAQMDDKTFDKAFQKLVTVLLAMSAAGALLKTSANAFSGIAFAIIGITIAFKVLQDLSFKQMAASATALGIALLALGGCFKIANGVMLVSDMKSMIGLGVVIMTLAGAMWILATIPYGPLAAATGSLAGILLALGVSFNLLGKYKINLAKIIAIGIAITALTAALYILANYADPQAVLTSAISMSMTALAVAGVITILQGINPFAAIKVATGIAGFIAVLTGAILGIAYIVDEVTSPEQLERFADITWMIGKIIGNLLGGLVSGALNINLDPLTKSIENFIPQVKEFLNLINNDSFTEESVAKIDALKEFFNSLKSISSVKFNKDFNTKIKTVLESLGESVPQFVEQIKGLTDEGIAKISSISAPVAELLTAVGNIPSQTNIWGKKKEDIQNALTGLGLGIKGLVENLAGVEQTDLDKMVNIKDPVLGIFDMLKDAPNSGGLLGMIVGENGGDIIGPQLSAFGAGLAEFAESIREIANEDIDKMSKLAQPVTDLFNALANAPNSGGLIELFTGQNDIADRVDSNGETIKGVASQLVVLGGAISDFLDTLVNVDPEKAEGAISVVAAIVEKLNELLDTDITGIGEELMTGIYGAMVEFTENQGKTKIATIAKSILTSFRESLDMQGGVATTSKPWLLAKDTMVELSRGLQENAYLVVNRVAEICQSAISKANEILGIHSPSRAFYKIGEYMDRGLAKGISDNSVIVDKANSYIADAIEQARAIADRESDMTITPVLDLSQVRRSAGTLGSILSTNKAYGISASFGTVQNGSTQTSGAQSGGIVFNQYNNSPKALSNIEIYRQTNNLISRAR